MKPILNSHQLVCMLNKSRDNCLAVRYWDNFGMKDVRLHLDKYRSRPSRYIVVIDNDHTKSYNSLNDLLLKSGVGEALKLGVLFKNDNN